MKTCTRCGESKTLEDFPKDASKRDGRHPRCKECHAAYYAENAARKKASTRRYKAANGEKVRAWQRDYVARHREECRERSRAWARKNPERARANVERRRARKANVPHHSFTRAEVLALHPRACCTYCGTQLVLETMHADHIVPLSPRSGERQGCHCLANSTPACAPCNQRKHNQSPSLDLCIELWDRARSPDHATNIGGIP